ncbi:NAD(P)/FAD-dependent oxidoreductase [Ekhidna sp.]|uniref:NAD(P)/FAD-dependent oxidoreductase n=1 Tax=Ekhidna sp. TaxID=2608089 RepID=UPI003CCB776C
MKDVIVIGGGLAGLVNAILLNRAGISVKLFEEKEYPFHRVCGEYISNEVIPFLKSNDLFPDQLQPSPITQFQLSAISGKLLEMPLDLGGFGISRYAFDRWLAEIAIREGVEIIYERIVNVESESETLIAGAKDGTNHEANIIIGAFGKRSTLDKRLDRDFLTRRSPYIGVKYHIKTDLMADDLIALHNFHNGYCGVSRVENNTFNLCYLSSRDNLRKHGSVEKMEQHVLMKNPFLKDLFSEAEFLFEKPQVINEITFEKKEPVFNHVLMSGDAAGMITPLCGNGMAMAIHSAKLLSELIIENYDSGFNRQKLEKDYAKIWNDQFANRLKAGRSIQKLFGSKIISNSAISIARSFSPLANFLMRQTHGQPF